MIILSKIDCSITLKRKHQNSEQFAIAQLVKEPNLKQKVESSNPIEVVIYISLFFLVFLKKTIYFKNSSFQIIWKNTKLWSQCEGETLILLQKPRNILENDHMNC